MKDPAVLFYTQDFLTGTMLMTPAQRGNYITLLCLQHQNGKLSERDMLKICGEYDEDIWEKFDKDERGFYYNVRMKTESERRKKYTDSRRNNLKKPHMDEHMNGHMEIETETVIEDEEETGKVVNFSLIVDSYNEHCPELSKVIKLSTERKKHVSARVREFDEATVIEVLKMAGRSKFLNGTNNRAWKASFDWIFKPANFIKILEGKYNAGQNDEIIKKPIAVIDNSTYLPDPNWKYR